MLTNNMYLTNIKNKWKHALTHGRETVTFDPRCWTNGWLLVGNPDGGHWISAVLNIQVCPSTLAAELASRSPMSANRICLQIRKIEFQSSIWKMIRFLKKTSITKISLTIMFTRRNKISCHVELVAILDQWLVF